MMKELLGSELPPNEYEYASSFRIYGAYKIALIWINKEERESPEWPADYIRRLLIGK